MSSSKVDEKTTDMSLVMPRPVDAGLLHEWIAPYKQPLSAYLASLYAIGVGFPLDSVKTRQQTYKYKNFWECVVQTKKNEGVAGFYRGIAAPLLSSSAVRTLSVSIYSNLVPATSSVFYNLYSKPESGASSLEKVAKAAPGAFFAGSLAGISCSLFAAPFEFTKLASQIDLLVQGNGVARNTLDVAKGMIKRNGFTSLYGGLRYHLLRDFFGSGTYFMTYDLVKLGINSAFFGDEKEHSTAVAVAGGLAGTLCWVLIYPIDTYKSLIQKDIYKRSLGVETPPRKFSGVLHRKIYRGLGASLVRTSVMGMMFFTSYEWLIKTL